MRDGHGDGKQRAGVRTRCPRQVGSSGQGGRRAGKQKPLPVATRTDQTQKESVAEMGEGTAVEGGLKTWLGRPSQVNREKVK